jgi:hypothetical protein
MRLCDLRLASLFLVSVCVIAFEMAVMRVFSVASWSNFGSMVISIALLGFGFAGTLLAIRGGRVRRNPEAWLSGSAFALGPAIAAASVLAQRVPFNPVLIATDPSQLWWIGAYYLVYFPPFFAGGLFIGTTFTVLSGRIHRLYFWNMVGSGLGGLLILGLMWLFPPGLLAIPLVALAGAPALFCCVEWSPVDSRFRLRTADAVVCVALQVLSVLLVARYGALAVSDFKPVSYARKLPDSTRVYESFGPRGQMEVYASSYFHFAPGLSDNASLFKARMPRNAFLGLFMDGDGPVGVMRKLSSAEEGYLDYLPMSAPYALLSRPRVLLLRLGGTAGVHTALHNGAREVLVVETNPDLIAMLRDSPYFRRYTGDILRDPRVRVVNGEVRAFARGTPERFDLVEIGLIDSYGLSQAGGYSVEENYLYTVEAIREYLSRLSSSGILSITVWDRLSPPRNVPKLLATVAEALRQEGLRDPQKHVFAFHLLLSTATVLVKNGEFTQRETGLLNEYCRRMSFDAVYYPGVPRRPGSFSEMLDAYNGLYESPVRTAEAPAADPEVDLRPGDLYHFALKWLFGGRQEELYSRYVFDIRPATDDRPYYSGYIKPRMIPQLIGRIGEISEEWGYLLLLGTLAQAVVFSLLIIVLPAVLRWRELFAGRRGVGRIIAYYGCLGLGYMMAEMFLIQRFVFFLSDPVYANALIITALLVSSGIGGLLSGGLSGSRRRIVLIAGAGIAGLSVFSSLGLPPLLGALLGLPLALKAVLTVALVFPIGFLMGIPFPAGLSALSRSRGEILPWAWGVNGALSVSGSVLTRVISTSAGFSTVLVGVALLYLCAGLLFRANEAAPLTSQSRASALR